LPTFSTRNVRPLVAGVLIALAALAAAPAAMAGTTKSTNWAGYAIHRPGVSFRDVSANWVQPGVSCVNGQPSYSAVWVGLGGYDPTSGALEQTGTEVDCNAAGGVRSTAWYELVPAPSKAISLPVAPGDAMRATVTVSGHQVVFDLANLTQHRRFHKTLYAPAIDVSSAEWIVEAPSACVGQFACQALPLANFGSVTFGSAGAASTTGTAGTIADSRWGRTKIRLTPGGQRFISTADTSSVVGTAAPSTLRGRGSAFDVTYAPASVGAGRSFTPRRSPLRAGYLKHRLLVRTS
jgi:hypothetical protein